MGPPSYMRSVVDRNVVMRRMTVLETQQFRNLQIQQRWIWPHAVFPPPHAATQILLTSRSS